MIRFTRGSKQFAIAKGAYAHVEKLDRDANMSTVNTGDGRRIAYNPVRLFGVEVFREEPRVLAQGDRIQFRTPDRALGVANGDFATIKSIDARRALLRLDNCRELSAALDRLNHIDHGYASTSHSAQGATVDRVIVDIDTRLSPELVNRKQFYVSIAARETRSQFIPTTALSSLAPRVGAARNQWPFSIRLQRPDIASPSCLTAIARVSVAVTEFDDESKGFVSLANYSSLSVGSAP